VAEVQATKKEPETKIGWTPYKPAHTWFPHYNGYGYHPPYDNKAKRNVSFSSKKPAKIDHAEFSKILETLRNQERTRDALAKIRDDILKISFEKKPSKPSKPDPNFYFGD